MQEPQNPPSNRIRNRLFNRDGLVGILGLALTVIQFKDLFPLLRALLVYSVGLLLILWAVWRLEYIVEWKRRSKLLIASVVTVIYCFIVAAPLQDQYQREITSVIQFKESASLSPIRKFVIGRDCAGAKAYLVSLNIPIPVETPPLALTDGPQSSFGLSTPPGHPSYRGEIEISESSVRQRDAVTRAYMYYVVKTILDKPLAQTPAP